MSFIPATPNRDLFAVLGVMAVAMLAVGLRARGRDKPPSEVGPVEGIEPSGGSEGVMTDAEASMDEGANGVAH